MKIITPAFIAIAFFVTGCGNHADGPYSQWRIKGGTKDGNQYSSLTSIDRQNVSNLKVAWTFSSFDADTIKNRTQIQCNPIIVDGVVYATTPTLEVVAFDALTGKELWKFRPAGESNPAGVNRGVTFWSEGNDKRILHSFGEFLYCINAMDGHLIKDFGAGGRVSLKEGLGDRASNLMVLSNTPGVIFNDLIILGSRVHEGPIAAPGHLRAFNVKTGKLAWVFHTIPEPGEEGYETWPADAWKKIGGANAWSGMTVDETRGLVFAATGSPSFDFYGGNRRGNNLYANCVLALDALTGKRKWHYQVIHHDMWDRDLPASPVLVTVTHENKKVDAVAQVTKTGYVYLFDRETGKPLFPIDEVAVPASDLEGEQAAGTQPLPLKPPPFARQIFSDDVINKTTPAAESEIVERLKGLRYGKQFIPPSREGTIIFPGFDGGAEWGGPSFDPETGTLYVNANEMPWILTMVDVRMSEKTWAGIQLYQTNCATCHGPERRGDGVAYPAIDHLQKKYSKDQMKNFISKGRGVMPAFSHLSDQERDAISRYVLDLQERTDEEKKGIFERHPDILYSNTGYTRFVTKDGYPAVEPPWGTLNAIDLNEGTIKWQVPLGEVEALAAKGIPTTGTENYGGSVVTKGGVVFVAATKDEKIRAFDKETGKVLWEHPLPAGGYATPAVYEAGGKEFLLIACGGGKMGTKSGSSYVAFALGN